MFGKIKPANVFLLVLLSVLFLFVTLSWEGSQAESINRLALEFDDDVVDTVFSSKTHREYLVKDGMVEVFILFDEQADTAKAAGKVTVQQEYSKKDLTVAVVNTLKETADKTQESLLEYLEQEKSAGRVEEYKSFFIVNTIYARLAEELIDEIRMRPEVKRVDPNPIIEPPEPLRGSDVPRLSTDGIEWNVNHIKAPEVWDQGIYGNGVVVGVIDSGVDWEHETLQQKWRGYSPDGNHDPTYSWFDPWDDENMPYDHYDPPKGHIGHGTHVAGIILGADPGNNNQIGVAPGAQWIAARIFHPDGDKSATAVDHIEAAEFMLAPGGDSEKAPDIINNSWGRVRYGLDEYFRGIVQSWRDAGILPVFAAGNHGPGYGSIRTPGNYPESFTVAAVDSNNNLAEFSGRGPTPYSHPESMQPDIAGPGVDVRSSVPGNKYDIKEGTSMAAPHIAGVAALLLDADPSLSVVQLENMIMNSADELTDETYPDSPNYGYGYGLVNALAALDGDKNAPPVPVEPELPPPLEDAAYMWVNHTRNPHIPKGPVTIAIPEGDLGVIKYNHELKMFGSDFVEENWYAIGEDFYNPSDSLYRIDPVTGNHEWVGFTGSEAAILYTGLAYDPVGEQLYASAFKMSSPQANKLYKIDQSTGNATLINNISGVDGPIYGIAFDADGKMYGADFTIDPDESGYLYSIDKHNGESSKIGPVGFNVAGRTFRDINARELDLAYDLDNDILYGKLLHLYQDDDDVHRDCHLYRLNTETGMATKLNYTGLVGGFAIPQEKYDIPTPDPDDKFVINVTANPVAGGSVSGGGSFEENVMATVTASPNDGYIFNNWTEEGNVVSDNVTYTFNVDRDRDLVANFEEFIIDDITRMFGANRYKTSAEVTVKALEYGLVDGKNVIIARGDNAGDFADGLAASFLAGVKNAPILLTRPDSLPGIVASTINDMGAEKAYILGGPAAIESSVKNTLNELVGEVERIKGDNRYKTAVKIANQGSAPYETAFVVQGHAPPDSMVAGPVAFSEGIPILLVAQDSVPNETRQAIEQLGINKLVLVGGPGVIFSAVEYALRELVGFGNVERLYGQNRFETSKIFAENQFVDPDFISIVNGNRGLADAVGAAVFGNPILYINSFPEVVYNYLEAVVTPNTKFNLFGGPAVITEEIQSDLQQLIDDAVPLAYKIKSIADVDDINVNRDTLYADIPFPEEVQITMMDDSTSNVKVQWEEESTPPYNPDVVGTYSFKGELQLPEHFVNPDQLKAEIDVVVKELMIKDGVWKGYIKDSDSWAIDMHIKNNTITPQDSPLAYGSSFIVRFPYPTSPTLLYHRNEEISINAEGEFSKTITTTGGDSITLSGKFHFDNTVTGEASNIDSTYNRSMTYEWVGEYYDPEEFTITVSADPEEGGTVDGGGTIVEGRWATVTAQANDGYYFVNWTEGGEVVSSDAEYQFKVTADRDLVARFQDGEAPEEFTINVSAEPNEGGTVDGGGTYTKGRQATVSAEPSESYQFVKWTEGGEEVSSDAEYTFEVTADRNLVAVFEEVEEDRKDGHWYGILDYEEEQYIAVEFNVKNNNITKDESSVEYEGDIYSLIIWFPHIINDELKWFSIWTKEDYPITEENLFIIDKSVKDAHNNDHHIYIEAEFIKEDEELFVDGFASHVCEDYNNPEHEGTDHLKSEYNWYGLHEDDITIEQAGHRKVPSDFANVVKIDLTD